MEENKKELKAPVYPTLEKDNIVEQTEAQKQEQRAKRDRDMAIIGDIANLVSKGAAMHGGAWKINKDENATAVANEKLAKLRESNSKQLAEHLKMRMAAADAARKERNAAKLAQYNADREDYKYANEQAYKERKEAREIAESTAKIARDEAYANYYNNGKPTKTGGGSGVNRDVYLINDDGSRTEFNHADTANNIQAAYAKLPPEYRVTEEQKVYTEDINGRPMMQIDENGLPVTIPVEKRKGLTLEEKRQAIERYNAREKKAAKKANPMGSGKKTNPMN